MSKEVQLSKGKVALVSDDDYEKVIKFKWYASQEGKGGVKWYAIRKIRRDGRQVKIRMHRFIMGLPTGFEDSRIVHHIDCEGLNNQRHNLEILETNQHNMLKEPGWQRNSEEYYI